ncbi:cohesin domain-containing protein [Lewinella sp. LCG006]|uniref:cohesin domain-containing protein n=1 Tax=Lewinella sp. LCG006 TaxID=3231911 RepID=UPI00345F38A3
MNGLLKHLFTGLLLLCFIQLVAQPTFTLSPSTNTVTQGNTFTVDVRVSNFTNVASIQFPITWNPAIISYQSISNINATALPGLTTSSFGVPGSGNAPNDRVILSWNHPNFTGVSLADQTVLFSLTFRGELNGTTLIEFNENLPQSIEILNPQGIDLGFVGNDAAATVSGGGGTPTGFTLSLADVSANQGDNICLPVTVNDFNNILGMQFSINYNAAALTFTGSQNFNAALVGFTSASIGNPTPGNLTFTWNDPFAAGVTLPNGATLLELCFTVTGSTTTTVSFSGTPTPIEIIDGNEMNVPFNSESGTVTVGGSGGPTGFTLSLADVSANQGDNVCLPVTVNDFNNILGMQFSINYDPAALMFTGSQNFNAALVGFTSASIGNPTPGNLTFTWNDPFAAGVTLPNGATLLELCFTVTGNSTTTVSFSGTPTPIEIIDGNEMNVPFNSESGTVTVGGSGPLPITLTLADVSADQGDNVCLPLTVTNFTNITSMQFNVNYNASILSFSGAQNFNATLPGWGAASITNPSPGVLTVNWSNATGVTLANNASLVRLCFDVTGNTTSDVTIPVPRTIQNGDGAAVNSTVNSGTVTVSPPLDGFTLILADATANQGDNVCLPVTVNDFNNILGMQFSINYDPAALTFTGAQNFNAALVGFTAGSVGNPTPGNLTFTWNDPLATGVTLPNGATIFELCFDVLTNESTTVVFSGMPTPIEVIDGDEMEVPFTGLPGTISPPTSGPLPITLTLADVSADQGDNVCLPLTVTNFTNITSMQFNVNYNASILSFSGAQNFNATLPGWGAASITNPSPGVLTVSWSNATGVTLANAASLVRLCFNVTGSTTSDVTIPSPRTIQNGDGAAVNSTVNSGTVTVSPPLEGFGLILADATASQGDNVCLPVTVNDFNNILGMQFSINYDPAALTFTGAQNFNAALVGFTAGSVGNPTPGNLTFTWNDPLATGVTLPNGATIFELCFDVLTNESTTVVFSGMPTPIEIIDGDEMEVPFTGLPGTISPPTSGPLPITFTLTDVTANQGDNVCLPIRVTNFTNITSMQFNINYNAAILSYTGAQNFNIMLPGWGAASITNPSPGVLTASWSNATGITLTDNSSLGRICFDVVGTTTSDVTMPSPRTIQNGDGDAVNSTVNSGTVTINPLVEGFALILADATAMTGDNVCLPVTVNDFNNILGMQFSINYDPAVLVFTSTQNFNPSLVGFTTASVGNPPPPGNLTTTWNDPFANGVTLPNGATIFEVCFDVIGSVTTTVSFSGMPTPIEVIDGDEMEVPFTGVPGTITIGQMGSGTFAASLSTVEACTGDNFCMDFTASTFTDIKGMQFSITYNSTDLSFAQISNINAGLPGLTAASFSASPGVINFQWESSTGNAVSLNPNSVLFSICFNKLTNNNSTVTIGSNPTPIEITDTNDDLVAFSGATGQVTCDPALPLQFGQVDVVNLTCADEPIGSITIVSMVNGSGNYTYQWSIPGQSGPSVTGRGASTITVTVTDTVTGMSVSGTYSITSPPAITGSVVNITNILCAGDNTGAITISAGGGVPPLSYNWSGSLPDNVTTQSNLSAGSYSVTIVDQNGCDQVLGNILVNELAQPIVLTGTVALIPGGGSPGGINLTVAGGTPGFTYSWTGPNGYTFGGQDPNNILTPGEYCVTVTDAAGCMASTCFNVYEVLRLTFFTIDDACPGSCNGGVNITIAGGSCPGMETYRWINLATNADVALTQDLLNACAGTYRVMITDCAGTSISADFTIEESDPIVLEATVTGVTGSNNGTITLTTVSGGSGSGYTFAWTGPNMFTSSMQNLANLAFGTYCVTVTDGAGCTQSACYMVDSAPLSIVQLVTNPVSCPGDTDGSVFFAIAGGQQPISITLNDGTMDIGPFLVNDTGERTITNLPAGNYTYTITDSGMNNLPGSFTIGSPDPLTVSSAIIFNDTEDAGGSGSVTIMVSGGTGIPTITWNGYPNGQQVNQIVGPTTITGIIRDENNCSLPISYQVLQMTESAVITDAGCTDSMDGSITVTAAGGTEPYTYVWTAEGSNDPISMDASIMNLSPNTYTVVITDGTGATLIRNYEIETQSAFTASAVVSGALDCFDSTDGEIQASVTNNGTSTSFTYEFELAGAMVGTNTTGTLGNAAPGTYTIFVIDNFMCEQQTTVQLTAPQPMSVESSVKSISCDGRQDGEIFVEAMGGTAPYSYSWSTGQTGQQRTNLAPGTYTLTVTDANDCQFIESYVVAESAPIIVTIETEPHTDADNCNGSVMAIVLGGNPPYTYNWLNIPGTPNTGTVTNLCAGTYMLQVTDASGCSSEVVSGKVADERFECFEDRVVITPDGNGSNDEFIIFCADALTDNHLEIYNRWGQLVYETNNYSNDWEGTSQNGDDLPAGPYYWVLDYSSPGSGEPLQKRGSLTIVRD